MKLQRHEVFPSVKEIDAHHEVRRGEQRLYKNAHVKIFAMVQDTLPTKLRRELFDNAGSMSALLETAALRGKIARFLHKHKDDEDAAEAETQTKTAYSDANLQATAIARWDDEGGAWLMPEQRTTAE